jgi:hypothetical protein
MKNGRCLPWVLALSLVIPLAAVVPAQANEGYGQIVAIPSPAGSEGVSIDEFGGFERFSARGVTYRGPDGSEPYQSWDCHEGNTGVGDCDLDNPNFNFGAAAILPYCETASQENCVEALEIGPVGSALERASFLRHVNVRTLPEIKSQGLIAGGSTPLFQSSIVHGGGQTTYAANVVAQIGYDRATKSFVARTLNVGVYAYNEKQGPSIHMDITTEWTDANGKTIRRGGFRAPRECRWAEQGRCGVEQAFSPGVEVKLTMRVPNTFTGWFRGRLKSPQISISRFSSSNTKIAVSAQPVDVARLHTVVRESDASPDQRAAILKYAGSGQFFRGGGRSMTFSHWGEFNYLEIFRQAAKDTAAGRTSHWSFSTIDNSSNNRCLASKSRVLGIVTTNATMYNGVVPAFRNGRLSYDVSGLHYLPNGELSLGSYDLVMRSDVARCLYGFSKAPLSANVSVVNNKGERSTATTVVGEKNGWLRLAAYGFTFSKKTIKVKLNQKPRR